MKIYRAQFLIMTIPSDVLLGRFCTESKDSCRCFTWCFKHRLPLRRRKTHWTHSRQLLKMLGFLCATTFGLFYQVTITHAKSSTNRFNRPVLGHVNYDDGGKPLTDEQSLLRELMLGYDRHTRPVMNASHPVRVKLGITLNQIFDLDERNQVLTTHIWLDQEWYDEKLVWDPDDFNGIQVLRVPCHLIWKPDIVLYNSADDYTEGYMPALAMVSKDGHVFWPPIVKLRSTCKIDITYFPFDDQTCSLKLGSWAYDGLQVDVLKRDKPIDLTNYVHNGEWQLINVQIVRNVEYYSCCPEPYPDVTFTLHIRRRTLYYTYNVIIPCIMLSCLTMLEFWMPPEGGEKVALGLTILLAFSVFMLLIAENMPATSFYIPLIGVYIIVVMGLTCVAVTCAVAISYISHQGSMGREVPQYMRTMANYLDKLVRVRRNFPSSKKNGAMGSKTPSSKNTSPSTSDTTCAADFKTPLRESFSSVNFSVRNDAEWLDFENIHALTKDPLHRAELKRSFKKRGGDRYISSDEILRKLDVLLTRHEELLKAKEVDSTCQEWKEVAEVIDRALFYVYSLVVTLASIVILILVPLGKSVSLNDLNS